MSTAPVGRTLGKAHRYRDPLDLGRFILGETIVAELASTEAFRRLKKIRFLGAIDYVLVRSPNQARQRYTRYQHSLGVAELARQYTDLVELPYEDRRLVWTSALLHDIGHAPLSHSLEHVFRERFGIDHHRATQDIILGQAAIGREVYDTLRQHRIDVERLLAIIDGQDPSFDGFFSGSINFDTVEGILRTIRYVANTSTKTHPAAVIHAATVRSGDDDRQIVDTFWEQKGFVYREIINGRQGIVADKIAQTHFDMHIDKFSRNAFFDDEDGLFEKLPDLRKILTSYEFLNQADTLIDFPVSYNQRTFFIDDAYTFQSKQDALRYRQKKSSATLLPRHRTEARRASADRDFFDDDPA